MTITLQVKPSVEALLRDQAAREGIDANTLALRTIEQQFGSSESPQKREAELLRLITTGLPDAVWQRYHELSAIRDRAALTPVEHQELLGLSEQIESAGVDRLEHLAELAHLRNVDLLDLQRELSIPTTGSRRA